MESAANAGAYRYISPRQFAVLVVTSFLALGLFQFPRELVGIAGPDSLYGFALDGGAALFSVWLHFQLSIRFPRATLGGVSRQLMGPLSWPFLLYALILHGLLAVVTLSNFAFVMQTFFLNRTPVWALLLSALLAVTYVTSGGTTSLARTMEMVFLPTMVLSLFMGSMMIGRMRSTYAILPSLHIWVSPTVAGAYHAFYIFWGMESINMLFPYVEQRNQPRARRITYWAMLTAFGFLMVGYFVVLGNSGPGLMDHLFWPPVKVMRVISLNSFLINKLGLIVVLVWGVFVFGLVAVREWALAHLVMSAFGAKSNVFYRRTAYAVGAGVFGGCLMIPNVVTAETITQAWLLPYGAAFLFGAPILLLGLNRVRHLVKRRPAPKPA